MRQMRPSAVACIRVVTVLRCRVLVVPNSSSRVSSRRTGWPARRASSATITSCSAILERAPKPPPTEMSWQITSCGSMPSVWATSAAT